MTSRPRSLAALAVLVSTLGTLGLFELVLRFASGDPFSMPDPAGALQMVGDAYPGEHHPQLGYVPRPGRAAGNVWGTRVTITPDGLRSNGTGPSPAGEPILAVGDSFTFGDEVDDNETWPARLEERLGRPVLNAGVFGYGLDQIVLRAEALLDRGLARTLLVSFAPDDVRRCEYSYRYSWKPWFAVEAGGLVLRGSPVPEPGEAAPGEALWRRALRVSFLGDFAMRRLDPEHWLLPDSLREHRQGVSVGRLLMDRLADFVQERGHRVLVVVQWHPLSETAASAPVIQRARERGLPVLDLEPELRRLGSRHPSGMRGYFHIGRGQGGARVVGHMNPEGNDLVARVIAKRLAASSAL